MRFGRTREAEVAELGTEAEAGDALVEAGAGAAGLEALEKAEEAAGEEQALLELSDLLRREFAPAGGDRRAGAEAVEEEFDFGEREIHFGGEADEEETVESVGGVAALA